MADAGKGRRAHICIAPVLHAITRAPQSAIYELPVVVNLRDPARSSSGQSHGGPASSHGVDLVRLDRQDQACLVTPAIPRIGGSQVPLSELLDVLGCAFARDAQDLTAN